MPVIRFLYRSARGVRQRSARILAITVAILLTAPTTQALGHIRSPGGFYFGGSLYRERDGTSASDPINLVFHADTANGVSADIEQVKQMLGHWEVNGTRMRGLNLECKPFSSTLYAYWLARDDAQNPRSTEDASHQDLEQHAVERGFLGIPGGFSGCGRQYHIRLYSDELHESLTVSHTFGSWTLAGVHHERIVRKDRKRKIKGHTIDWDWDAVANQAVYALRAYCSDSSGYFNPKARRYYGSGPRRTEGKGTGYSYHNMGIIRRVSVRLIARSQTEPACDGALPPR